MPAFGLDIGSEIFYFEQIPRAARHIHGYHMFRAFANYHYYLMSNLERWQGLDVIDQNFLPKQKTLSYLFWDPQLLEQVCAWHLFLYFSHDHAIKKLSGNLEGSHRERLLYLRSYDRMNVYKYQGSDVASLIMMPRGEVEFRNALEAAIGQHMQIVRIVSPLDHYMDTIGVTALIPESFYRIAHYVASQQSVGLVANAVVWKEQVSCLVENAHRIVVFLSAPTPSILWELDEVRRQSKAGNCLIVIPTEAAREGKGWSDTESDQLRGVLGDAIWDEKMRLQQELSSVEAFKERYRDFRILCSDTYQVELARELTELRASERARPNKTNGMPFDLRGAIPEAEIGPLDRFKSFIQGICRAVINNKRAIFPPWVINCIQHSFLAALIVQDYETAGRNLAFLAGAMQFYADSFERYFIPGNGPEAEPAGRKALGDLERTENLCMHLAVLLLQLSTNYERAIMLSQEERRFSHEGLSNLFKNDLDRLYGR